MNEGDYLLKDILAAPDDDGPRLICADWLADNGQPDRAEFIRLQIQFHKEIPPCTCSHSAKKPWCDTCVLQGRLGDLHDCDDAMEQWCWPWSHSEVLFERGFVTEVTAPLDDLREHLAKSVTMHPLRKVTAACKYPQHFRILTIAPANRPMWRWVNAKDEPDHNEFWSSLPSAFFKDPTNDLGVTFDSTEEAYHWLSEKLLHEARTIPF